MNSKISDQTFSSLAIGAKCPICIHEEAQMEFTTTGITLYLKFDAPGQLEISCFNSHPVDIQLFSFRRTGNMLIYFGQSLSFDCSFNAESENPNDVIVMNGESANTCYSVKLVGVDAETNKIFGIRSETIRPNVSRHLSFMLQLQMITNVVHQQDLLEKSRTAPLYTR
jgi:hypothetical protein